MLSIVDQEHFESLKKKYGYYSSWAIWAEEGDTPKSNVGDLSVFEGTNFLSQLNPNVVLVGLNISRDVVRAPLANFHDIRPKATDFKIRYALKNSPWWGGYMTDIIKDYAELSSGKVMKYLKENKSFEKQNVTAFKEELEDLGVSDPLLIALGGDTHSILDRNFGSELRIIRVLHYASYINRENYRKELSKFW